MKFQELLETQQYVIKNQDVKDNIRCIDDRDARTTDDDKHPLPAYGIPGSGLGIFTDVVSGFETVLSRGLTDQELAKAWSAAESLMGDMYFHDGVNHNKSHDSCAAGCGYCAATVEGAGTISADAATFVKARLAVMVGNGFYVPSFPNDHDASYVVIVTDYETGFRSTLEDGSPTCYVFHAKVQEDLLTDLATAAFALLKENMGSIDTDTVVSVVLEKAGARFAAVAAKLPAKDGLTAMGIPHFKVGADHDPIPANPLAEQEVGEMEMA